MARMKKTEVIEALTKLGIEFDTNGKYNDLCKLLKAQTITAEIVVADRATTQIKITNRLKKRNTFLADAVRDERDREFLNKEISQRKYKGKLKDVHTIKHYEVSADGYWVTEFIIDLKE